VSDSIHGIPSNLIVAVLLSDDVDPVAHLERDGDGVSTEMLASMIPIYQDTSFGERLSDPWLLAEKPKRDFIPHNGRSKPVWRPEHRDNRPPRLPGLYVLPLVVIPEVRLNLLSMEFPGGAEAHEGNGSAPSHPLEIRSSSQQASEVPKVSAPSFLREIDH